MHRDCSTDPWRVRVQRFRARLSTAGAWQAAAAFLAAGSLHAADSARSEPPLPEAAPLLRRLLEGSPSRDEEKSRFDAVHAYVRTRIREERNPKGELKNRSEQRDEHSPEAVRRARDASTRESGEPKGRAYRERDVQLTQEILDRFVFRSIRREPVNGVETVRIEFEPRDGHLPGHRFMDRFINRMAGTLWLQETDAALVRAELRLTEEVAFLGGIAGVVHALQGSLDRAHAPDGQWYTRASQWRVDYREFLVRKVVDLVERMQLTQADSAPGGSSVGGDPASR